jgi:hypothetical protein
VSRATAGFTERVRVVSLEVERGDDAAPVDADRRLMSTAGPGAALHVAPRARSSPAVKEAPMSDISWLGNRVQLEEIEGTDLTYVQWRRPWHGSLRGYLVVGSEERELVETAVEDAHLGRREHPRLDAAGRPTDLEAFFSDVLGRRPGDPAASFDVAM